MRGVLLALTGVLLALVGVALFTRYLGASVGGTITSWWRSPMHNQEVGGLPSSLHILGWAVDVVPATESVASALRAKGFPVVVNEGDHIHAAWLQA